MAYGTIKVDTITFTDGGIDKSVAISGLVQNPTFTGNVTVTGTVSGNTVQGQTISGVTVTGTTANFTSGNFTNISGGTHTITSGVFALGTAANPSISFTSDPNTGIYSPGADQVAISTNGTGRLFVDASGKVGVGVATPGAPLDIKLSGDRGIQAIASVSAPSYIRSYQGAVSNNIRDIGLQGNNILFETGPTTGSTTTEAVRITSDGKLGLGTSSPTQALQVAGAIVATGAAATYAADGVYLQNKGSSIFDISAWRTGANASILTFSTDSGSDAAPVERVRIGTDGKVGIGTTSPGSALEVSSASNTGVTIRSGSITDNGFINFTDGAVKGQILYDHNGDYMRFYTNGGEAARIDSSGRLLVGTSTGAATGGTAIPTIQLAGTSSVPRIGAFGLNATPWLVLARTTSTSIGTYSALGANNQIGRLIFAGDDGTDYQTIGAEIAAEAESAWTTNDAPTRLVFSTTADGASSPTERMRLDSSGRLGLGTSSPAALCHLRSDANSAVTHLYLQNRNAGASAQSRIAFTDSANDLGDNRHAYIGAVTTGAGQNGNSFVIATNPDGGSAQERVWVSSTGNVGIGVTAPDAGKLHILNGADAGFTPNTTYDALVVENGTSGQGPVIQLVGATNGIGSIGFSDTTRNAAQITYDHSINTLYTYVNGAERMRIDSSGRLLVGTSTADNNYYYSTTAYTPKVQIKGTDIYPFAVQNTSGAALISLASGLAPAADYTIGALSFNQTDGSKLLNAASITAFVDGTPGANDMPGRLVFSTCPDGSAAPVERMRITNGGSTFFNTTSDIGSARVAIAQDFTAGNGLGIKNTGAQSGGQYFAVFYNSSDTLAGSIAHNGSASVSFNTSSDYRLKENVVPLTGAADRLKLIPVRRFNFIAEPGRTVDGFIAHEAQAVVPECATGTKDEVDADGKPVYQGIDQSKLVPLLTAALQEALAEIESLKARVTALEP